MKTVEYDSTPKAICMGKFEALHLGHIRLIEATVGSGMAAGLLSFVPHPAQVLRSGGYRLLYTPREQERLLRGRGLDYWLRCRFDAEFAEMDAEAFCEVLCRDFGCRALFVGESFRFGKDRKGTVEDLRGLGLEVVTVPYLLDGGAKVGTSLIREYLSDGKVEEANRLLGHAFFVMGEVKKGRQLGRELGFPTANLLPSDGKFLPPNGVYAVKAHVGGKRRDGICNVGVSPTVTEKQERRAEVHIFDFDGDIYGEEMVVEFERFVRGERRFSGVEELKRQIGEDVDYVVGIIYNAD